MLGSWCAVCSWKLSHHRGLVVLGVSCHDWPVTAWNHSLLPSFDTILSVAAFVGYLMAPVTGDWTAGGARDVRVVGGRLDPNPREAPVRSDAAGDTCWVPTPPDTPVGSRSGQRRRLDAKPPETRGREERAWESRQMQVTCSRGAHRPRISCSPTARALTM